MMGFFTFESIAKVIIFIDILFLGYISNKVICVFQEGIHSGSISKFSYTQYS